MIFDNLNRYRLQIYGFLLFYAKKKGTPAMNPKPGSQVKIGRKSKHPATETGVTEMQQTENQDETHPLTNTKQIRKRPQPAGTKKSVPQLAVCGTDIRVWRKERDSNPRYSYPYTAFRVRPDRPLRHLSMSRPKNRCLGTANIDIIFINSHFLRKKFIQPRKKTSHRPRRGSFTDFRYLCKKTKLLLRRSIFPAATFTE